MLMGLYFSTHGMTDSFVEDEAILSRQRRCQTEGLDLLHKRKRRRNHMITSKKAQSSQKSPQTQKSSAIKQTRERTRAQGSQKRDDHGSSQIRSKLTIRL